ncbi:hypothetical protein CBM2615_A120004 [Cupriavidus taiwanensis]|uniref:Uncharacterized protein n=1 Tax=Cupriavidus taiwanensis TaxID=164546 RepID=A0A976ASW9_9BURK|nr:hypothetical protein [Cupriavidus taiwanensis]SOZ49052.1 hypothetical protein CBM2614_A120004 [Cupriavidus taiwanensis]SOZ49080.1 hypothetical protein CBM2615_A120004 [Cupriavidus taiwanensis]SOZ51760.1 hypothetical protein CBM2613_A110004 [Cupriavidus taiwanensis]SPA07015.1 hypothetical protein CBM2625_A90004 [Cupriavidus taiwanensis]
MTRFDLPFIGSITDGANTVLCAEIASDVADAIAALRERHMELPGETPYARVRREAINTTAERWGLPVDIVASAYAVYDCGSDRGPRPPDYADNRATRADRLAILLAWAFRRLPPHLRTDATPLRLAAAIDKLACAAVPCDMGDLSRLRNGKRGPISARPATAVAALLLSTGLLNKVLQHASTLSLLDNEKHREVVTEARLKAAASRLLRVAHKLNLRTARKVGEHSPTNLS